MAYIKPRAGTNFPTSLFYTSSAQYDASFSSWAPWGAGGEVVGLLDGASRTCRFKFKTPASGTRIDSLRFRFDGIHGQGGRYAPVVTIVKASQATTETYIRPASTGSDKVFATTIRSGYLDGTANSSINHFDATITTDAKGAAIAFNTDYYMYIMPSTRTTANYHAWHINAYSDHFEVRIDASITTYTNCSGPTTVTASAASGQVMRNNRIIPGRKIKLSWSGAKHGTANSIRKYIIDYWEAGSGKWVNNYTSKSSSATSDSIEINLPSNTRGKAYEFRVRAEAPYNTAGTKYSQYVYNNTLPGVPTGIVFNSPTIPSTSTSTTISSYTAGAAGGGGLAEVYSFTSTDTSNARRVWSGNTYDVASPSSTYYFRTWDGLEYSSYTTYTLYKNTKPTISSLTHIIEAPTSQPGYSSTTYPFGVNLKVSMSTSKASGTVYYEAKVGTTTTDVTSATWQAVGNNKFSSSSYSSTISTIGVVSATQSGNSFQRYIKLRYRYHDGIEYSDWQELTNGGFYTGDHISTIDAIYNTAGTSDQAGANTNHFYQDLHFEVDSNAAITNRTVYYSTSSDKSNAAEVTGASYIQNTSGITIKGITTGPVVAGQKYYFWIRSRYSDGSTKDSTVYSKTRVPAFKFENIVLSSEVAKTIQYPDSEMVISFAQKGYSDHSIAPTENFALQIFYGTSNQRNIPYILTEEPSATKFTAKYSSIYPMKLDAESGDNPFNLEFNKEYQVNFRISIKNAFGVTYTGTSAPFTLSLKHPPYFSTNYPVITERYTTTTDKVTIPTNAKVFAGEKIYFRYEQAISRNGTSIDYSLERRDDNGAWISINRRTDNAIGTTPNVVEYITTLSAIGTPSKRRYSLVADDGINPPVRKEFDIILLASQQGTPIIEFREIEGDHPASPTLVINVDSLRSFSGDTSLEGSALKEVKYYWEGSLDAQFQTDVSVAQIPGSPFAHPNISALAGINNYTPATWVKVPSSTDITYYRIKMVLVPDTDGHGATTVESISNIVAVYPSVPTYRWRPQYLGINTLSQSEDAAFEVQDTPQKYKVYFKTHGGKEITIDVRTQEIDGAKIDGGTY